MAVNLEALLKLKAQVSGITDIERLRGSLAKLETSAKDVKRSFKDVVSSASWQVAAAGAAAVGTALGVSVKQAASFQSALGEIGKTAQLSTGQLQGVSDQILELTERSKTNLSAQELAAGLQDLVAAGLSIEQAAASLETVGRVATATGADITDVTKAAFQLQNALQIDPSQLKETFDALAFAGKQGAFELRDMAQYLPTIASAAASLGVKGKEGAISLAAMMQAVRRDAPDSAQAATRLTDALLKLTAPQTVKNFSKFGVDIEKVLKDAVKNGMNPFEAAIEKIREVTGGDPFLVAELFQDKEARLAIQSLIKYREEWQNMKKAAGEAGGLIDEDYRRSIESFNGVLKSFQNAAGRLGIALGTALLPALTSIAQALIPVAEVIGSLAQRFPALTGVVVALAGALAGLVVLAPAIASLITIISTLGPALAGLAGIGAVIAGWAGAVIPAITGLGAVLAGLVSWPALIIAGLVALGVALFAFRDQIFAAIGGIPGLFEAAAAAIAGPFVAALDLLSAAARAAWDQLRGGFDVAMAGIAEIAQATWRAIVDGLQAMANAIANVAAQIGEWLRRAFNGVVEAAAQAWDAIAAGGAAFVATLEQIAGQIAQSLNAAWQQLVELGSAAWQQLQVGFDEFVASLQSGINTVSQLFATAWQQIVAAGLSAWTALSDGVRTVWQSIVDFVTQTATSIGDRVKAVWQGIANGVRSMWDSVVATIRGAINSVLSSIQGTINAAISGINSLINAYNRIPNLPDIPTAQNVNIPQLASGGVVTRPTLALIGEGGEPEYVIPQSKVIGFASSLLGGSKSMIPTDDVGGFASSMMGGAGQPFVGGGGAAPPAARPISIDIRPRMMDMGGQRLATLEEVERIAGEVAFGVAAQMRGGGGY